MKRNILTMLNQYTKIQTTHMKKYGYRIKQSKYSSISEDFSPLKNFRLVTNYGNDSIHKKFWFNSRFNSTVKLTRQPNS